VARVAPTRIIQVTAFLCTERMGLRRVTADDVDLLVELNSDPAVMAYLTGGRPTSRVEVETVLVPRYLDEYERGVAGRWLAHDLGTGEFLGWFGLDSDTSPPDARELGYRLRTPVWGRGLATEGSRALIDYAFGDLGLRRVWAQTMAVNAGSRRVLEKSGLHYVRTMHPQFDQPIPGSEHGEVEYELLRDEWAQRG
jgi:RimJ/RimL family protein N-acetyltransferase